jgi:hypothetical protein
MSYITPRILAMAFPASGLEASFRNPRQHVRNYLNQYHEGEYLIFNLCAEKRYQYDSNSFSNKLVCIPVKQHSVPTLYQVADFCQQAMAWLNQSDTNIVVTHCLGGRGRTGLMVASLLIASRVCNTAPEAIELFNAMRANEGEVCLKLPSQIRCVKLFEELLALSNYSVPLSITSLSVTRFEWALLAIDIGPTRAWVYSVRVHPRSSEAEKELELPLLLAKREDLSEKEVHVDLKEAGFTCNEDCHVSIKMKRGFGSSVLVKFWIFSQMSQTMINHRCTSSDGQSTVFLNAEDLDAPSDADKLLGPKSVENSQRFFVKVSLQFRKLT